MNDEVPEEIRRQREVFRRVREDIRRVKPDKSPMNWEFTEAQMIESLDKLERVLETEEVRRIAREYCDRLEAEARGGGGR